jgi:hypothetical protein
MNKAISSILNAVQFKKLNVLCGFGATQGWTLLYRGSVDGFASSAFHSKCDGRVNTLTIVKSTNDCVFGGYTTTGWNLRGQHIQDANAFIYSFISKSNAPVKMNCVNATDAIYGNAENGPCFGGEDLCIPSDCNLSANCSSRINGLYYTLPAGYTQYFLTGKNTFQVKEIEVFTKA